MKVSLQRALPLLMALFSFHPALAVSRSVPGDRPTIQLAIDDAVNGDEVVVAPGTYHEHLDFKGKAITLRSESGPAVTILDGDDNGSVVSIGSGEGRDTVLQGFTIRHGNAFGGGGVHITAASPTIVGNVFEENHGYGAAIYMFSNGTPRIERNVIRNHSLCHYAVNLEYLAEVEFVNNVIVDNNCPGLHMWIDENVPALVANNTIARNTVGFIYRVAYTGHLHKLKNNIIYGNGTGFRLFAMTRDPSPPVFTNNLVYGNGINYDDIADLTNQDGNMSVDPLLHGLDLGDYHPDTGSPVIDSGDTVDHLGPVDYYGESRIYDGGRGWAATDMGATEFHYRTPFVNLDVGPAQIPLGGTAILSWSTADADGCEARGAPWSGSKAANGTEQWTSNEPDRPIFQLVCTGAGGIRDKSVQLIVGDVFPVQMNMAPASIDDDQSATLTWSVPDATSCEASGAWTGPVGTSGSRTVNHENVHGLHEYKLFCKNATGTGVGSATVEAHPRPWAWVYVDGSAGVYAGDPVQLTWTSTDTASCTASGEWTGELPANGSRMVTAPNGVGLHTYTVTCHGPTSDATSRATIQVHESASKQASASGGSMPWELMSFGGLLPALRRKAAH